MFQGADIILLITAIVAVVAVGLYFLNKWASRKMTDQQSLIEKSKQSMSIFVIDKKKMKVAEANLPKAVTEKMPKIYKFIKMPMVKAKIGPQIMTLMCEKKVYEAIPVKKNIKVEMAGIYIVGVKSGKSEPDKKEAAKAKKREAARQFDGSVKQSWFNSIPNPFKKK